MAETDSTPSNPPPLSGIQLTLGSIALALATFMNVLDMSIANVSLPAISGDLGVSPHQGTWVITSFAVSNAISVPLTGWLSQRFGQVRLFIASVLLFVVSSMLCGLAPHIGFLISARVLQGLVAGPMIPMSQALLLLSYPKERSGMALAIWGMTTLVAPVIGPILGGWISEDYAWPWIFYINIPIGLICAAIIWRLYRQRESVTRKLPIDRFGLLLLVIWVAAIQLLLDKGKELDWFNSNEIITLAVIALIGFVFFLIWELTEKHPIVDLSLFRQRNFLTGVIAFSFAYGTFFGNVVLLPLWLQTQLGYTAIYAGLMMAPVGILAMVLTPIVGRNLNRWDPRWVATTGFVFFALVFYMRSQFTANVDLRALLIPTIIQGIPMAMFFVPINAIMLSGLPPERIPAATGLSNFCRMLMAGFGASIGTTMWERRNTLHHERLTEAITNMNQQFQHSVHSLSAAGLNRDQINRLIDSTISQQAGVLGINDMFWASAMLFLVLIVFIWLSKPVKAAAAGAGH